MSGKVFFDSNILRYTVDDKDSAKCLTALRVTQDAVVAGAAVISYQVMQEFLNVGFKKFVPPLSPAEGRVYLWELAQDFLVVEWSYPLLQAGLNVRERYGFSWYDSLIVAAALSARCTTLYTEDWQHLQVIEGMTIVNPFL